MRIAWGITGCGDYLSETIELMTDLSKHDGIDIRVFLSKAGKQVLHWYKLWDVLNETFKVKTEVDANVPFIAGPLQVGKYDVFVVAPLSANSAAKIAHGISDSLITNAVAQTLKGETPVILYPVDQEVGETETISPDGTLFKIRVRSVDVRNVDRIREMHGVTVLDSVEGLRRVVLEKCRDDKSI